ncbi:histidine phosphatase family protein [Paenibacillus sp. SN-8-1]|uniref:histidine phosphatase family protein n=1 Tax=Paenibacillus sp. SN-8-1 TaxID=3435409 RepID=UPI003D9A6646
MKTTTTIYFVRHAESPYVDGQERSRCLSDKGRVDSLIVGDILQNEEINHFVSSPYDRAIQTIKNAAGSHDITTFEDLRERNIGVIPENKFKESKFKVYQDFDFSFPEGESSTVAQQRAIRILMKLLSTYGGTKVVIGTHGDIMTLMMNYFDKSYDYNFWDTTTMPDIYKLDFNKTELIKVTRLWE